MPGNAPPVRTEVDGLLVYLRQQRAGLLNAGYGLTPEQLRLTPTVSALSVGGLIKHASRTEKSWADVIAGHSEQSEDAYVDSFALGPEDTLESLTAEVAATAAATEAVVAATRLDAEVTLPAAPWMPTGGGYTVRWALLHIFEELSRHAGHADLVREHVDGATMYALMAAVEGWPETDWLKPWRPEVAAG
ncbi:DinB family protein [uncultured Friedmanniella sp.]|uniref:DinB family protein n=1 Tax=uncultured Friedmanniella sp. TaxID=335381 RepID=UPI0035C9EBFE